MLWIIFINRVLLHLVFNSLPSALTMVTTTFPVNFLLLFSITAVFSKYGQVYDEDPSLISTPYGLIQGTIFANEVVMFRSIPYAEPPIDNHRWSQPIPKEPWGPNKTLYATQNPPGCPQVCDLPPNGCPMHQSEDCLFLNIFKPLPPNNTLNKNEPETETESESQSDLLPVMIFFHGGNFYQGFSGGPLYNGTRMTLETDVIIVTVNYRLGALGFLWSITGPSGNYGMLDQMLSIQWVHDNIQYFGGDPNKVILYGQSAGNLCTFIHILRNISNYFSL